MPRGNGTGPAGTGRRAGRGGGQGRGRGAQGQGRMGGPFAAGPGGNCICPQCGHTVLHIQGRPCSQQTCPKCGGTMARQI